MSDLSGLARTDKFPAENGVFLQIMARGFRRVFLTKLQLEFEEQGSGRAVGLSTIHSNNRTKRGEPPVASLLMGRVR